MNANDEVAFLKKRVSELEKQLDNLRLSRRVLMDLLEQVEKEKNTLSQKLDKRQKNQQKNKKNHLTTRKLYSPEFELVELKNYMKE